MNKLQRLLCAALRDHLAGGKPRPPEGGAPLWDAFLRLSAARSYHQFGANPISYAEVEAYTRLMNLPLQPHHVLIIRAMDAVFLEHFAPGKRAPDGVKAVPHRSPHALSPALFDAALG